MNKTKVVIASSALVAVIGGQAILFRTSDTPPSPDCVKRRATCDVLEPGNVYSRYEFPAWVCPEGDIAPVPRGKQPRFEVVGECQFEDPVLLKSDQYKPVEFECAWRPPDTKPGKCQRQLSDGGYEEAPANTTMKPGRWAGSGCKRRSCVEVAGIPWGSK